MASLNFGVIGVGEMGKFHAETLRHHVPGARLIALADVNLARAKSVASDLEIESFYDNIESLLARTDIHAVVISSPPKFHGSAIRLAAAARKHIFCEKPLAITLEDADSALDAVSDAGLTLKSRRVHSAKHYAALEETRVRRFPTAETVVFTLIF
jgi:myo-inositol 2-dehydrogenase / D-chiro-inositol 1-dehydrogenase